MVGHWSLSKIFRNMLPAPVCRSLLQAGGHEAEVLVIHAAEQSAETPRVQLGLMHYTYTAAKQLETEPRHSLILKF